MADEILTATEALHFATTRLAVPRGSNFTSTDPKERSGISIGEGYVLTESRFITPNNGGVGFPTDKLTVTRGAEITGAVGATLTASVITELAASDGTEIALVTTTDTAGPSLGLIMYADPSEASGAMTLTGYSRSDDGGAAREYDFTLGADSYETVTLKNRIVTDDVWLLDLDPAADVLLTGGAGAYQTLDLDGDGVSTTYAAGLLVGPYVRQSPTDLRIAVDPISDVYESLAAAFEADGVSADALARNALVASSAGGTLDGTYLNEDFFGSDAADIINGGAGNDSIRGERSNDALSGDAGNDTLLGGLGEDTLSAGDGNDNLNGQGSDDVLFGGAGDDMLKGANGNDALNGDDGNDTLISHVGDDTLDGGNGADVLNAGNGADLMFGGAGNDRLVGGNGNDTLSGGAGNDRLFSLAGSDVMTGGAGNDVFVFSDDGGDTILDFTLGDDRLDVRGVGANDLADLILTTSSSGVVTASLAGDPALFVTLNDGDGVVDFGASDFTASDFIF